MASSDLELKMGLNLASVRRIAVHIIQDLFYPATLGALLYNFALLLDNVDVLRAKPLASVSVVLILLYFTTDYVWTKLWTLDHPYKVIAALCDLVALILILLTERSINPISGSYNVALAAEFLAIVHLLYTIWCAVEKMYSHLAFKAIFAVLFGINWLWYPHLELFVVLQILLWGSYVYAIVQEELARR
jgi:hypothetical protein